jgi:hypothetical protein
METKFQLMNYERQLLAYGWDKEESRSMGRRLILESISR